MEAYPYTNDDVYAQKALNMAQFTRAIHNACYDMTALREDVPFLTV